MRFRLLPVVALLCSLSFAQYPGAKGVPGAWRIGFNSIKEQEARDILGYLAGKDLRGRGSLTQDYWAAAGFVANELRQMGLRPAGADGSYFQRFDYIRATAIPSETKVVSEGGDFEIPYGEEFQTAWVADLSAKVKFAFVNIPEKADLAAFKWELLKGKWVIYSPSAFRNPTFAAKLATAREEYGIEQMIASNQEKLSTSIPSRAVGIRDMPDPRVGTIGQIRFSKSGVAKLGRHLGIEAFFKENPTEVSVELPLEELTVKTKSTLDVFPLTNVIAKLEGSDPAMSKEAVILGSHLDHMGEQRGSILYGADDNASGCTANLMIAKALVSNPTKPKRSVLFCFWAAEEVGTYGSFAYAMKPAHPPADTVAYINMDMLGRDEDTGPEIAENNRNVVYPGTVLTTSKDFYDRLVANNAYVGLRFKPDRTDRTNRSDTRNFVWKNVPTVKIFTGEHPDYHRAGDTLDKINWTKLVNITKWLYLTTADLASRPDRPRFERKAFVAPDYLILAGRATLKEGVAVPAKSILRVGLFEVGSTNAVATRDFPTLQNRTPYELLVPKASLKEGGKYELRMEIRDGKRVLFSSPSPVEVPTAGWTRAKDVELKMATSG